MTIHVETNELSSTVESEPADEFLALLKDQQPMKPLPTKLLASRRSRPKAP